MHFSNFLQKALLRPSLRAFARQTRPTASSAAATSTQKYN